MIDHLGINCTDLPRAAAFYDRVLGVLGHRRVMDFEEAIGYGTEGPDFWISTFDEVGPNREVHVAFSAPDAATVAKVSLALGARGSAKLQSLELVDIDTLLGALDS